MIMMFTQGAPAPTGSSAVLSPFSGGEGDGSSLPQAPREQVRHLLFGTLVSVRSTIAHLHALGYADPNDWSRPISTGRPNEVMAILTKRVSSV